MSGWRRKLRPAALPADKRELGDYVRPAVVTVITTAVLIYVALVGARRREL